MIVTISREYGAAGLAVADGVAHALGYALLADDLSRSVAARLGTSADEVSARAGGGESLPERMLSDLGAATPEAISPPVPALPGDFDESLRREMEREIRERAARGDVVILGRSAGALLGPGPGVLRVFLCADREWRVRRLRESFGCDREEALDDIERIDSARRKTAKDRYKMTWGDARFYDVTVDVSRFGIDGAVELVVAGVRAGERAGAEHA